MDNGLKFSTLIKPIFGGESGSNDEPPDYGVKDIQAKIKKFRSEPLSTIQTPRLKIVALPLEATLREAAKAISESGYSKIPVIQDSKDQVKGVIYAKDILKNLDGHLDDPVSLHMKAPHFVSFSQSILELSKFFRDNRTTVAFVVDEFGGVDGVVTVNDLNWELFGKIKDHFDCREEPKLEYKDNRIVVDSDYEMDDFIQLYRAGGEILPDGNETLGGFICHNVGRIPRSGEEIEINRFRFKILEANNRKITKISIEEIPEDQVAS